MRLFKHERIDGPGHTELDKNPHRSVAYSFLWGVANRGAFIHKKDSDERYPQGYRVGTWVENRDSRFGHAFGLSRTQPVKNKEAFLIQASLFHVDREKEKMADAPKQLLVTTDLDIHEQIDGAMQTYDKDEMLLAINIMNKMKDVLQSGSRGHLDMHVAHGLVTAHLDTLGEMFPEPGTQRSLDT